MSEEHGEKKKHKGGGHGPPHGGSHEEHEGAPEWLISFADNVTLMMGFFVLLLAMNLKPASGGSAGGEDNPDGTPGAPTAAALDMAIAIREAFHNPVDPGSSRPEDLPLIQRLYERTGESTARQDGQRGREQDVRSIRPGKYIVDGGVIAFSEGSSELEPAMVEAIVRVAKQIQGLNLVIEIRGHASAAEAFRLEDRGMNLSYERALAVSTELVRAGSRWTQFRLTACGDNDRVVSRAYNAEGHRTNARVELTVTDQLISSASTEESAQPGEPNP